VCWLFWFSLSRLSSNSLYCFLNFVKWSSYLTTSLKSGYWFQNIQWITRKFRDRKSGKLGIILISKWVAALLWNKGRKKGNTEKKKKKAEMLFEIKSHTQWIHFEWLRTHKKPNSGFQQNVLKFRPIQELWLPLVWKKLFKSKKLWEEVWLEIEFSTELTHFGELQNHGEANWYSNRMSSSFGQSESLIPLFEHDRSNKKQGVR